MLTTIFSEYDGRLERLTVSEAACAYVLYAAQFAYNRVVEVLAEPIILETST